MKKVLFGASVYRHLTSFHKPFMNYFQSRGYEVHAIGSDSLGGKEELVDLGVICHDIEFDRLPFSKKNLKAVKELKLLFNIFYFEIIHVHTPTAAFLTRYVAKEYNQGRVIYTAHGFHFFKGASRKNWLLFYPVEKIATKWTDMLIVMNEEDVVSGEKLGFIRNKNLFFVNGVGVDLKEYAVKNQNNEQYLKQELNLDKDAILLTCVAELISRKNQLFLLKTWKEIIKNVPSIHLILVGQGPDKQLLEDYILKNNLINVHVLGHRKDIPQIMASSDIITLVSKQEGLPRCIMEGMAFKKPIIATNIRGSSDLVVNNETGLLVNLQDDQSLINAVIKLAKDKKLRIVLGEKGGIKIQDYSIENVLKDMTKIYEAYL